MSKEKSTKPVEAGADQPELFAKLKEQRIHMMPIPTPFAIGPVNSLLIEDDPLTLVDPGPNSGDALDELERQIGEAGHTIEAVGLIVVTHQHIDHLGLVDIVARRSGAEVACLDRCVPYLEHYEEESNAADKFGREMMLRHGLSSDVANALYSVSRAFRS